MGNLKENLTIKALLGTTLYESVSKYVQSWKAEWELSSKRMPWNDYLIEKANLQQAKKSYNVYKDGEYIAKVKADSILDAVNQVKLALGKNNQAGKTITWTASPSFKTTMTT